MSKTGILLVNLGTPDSPEVSDVRRYLREFLMDERVIDIPYWKRWLLINLIIAPLRGPKSSVEYKKLWNEKGSPLKYYGEELTELLAAEMGDDFELVLAMRYQNPSIRKGLQELQAKGVSNMVVVPLFPQYAEASTGSVIVKVAEEVKSLGIDTPYEMIEWFHHEEVFIDVLAQIGKAHLERDSWEHILFSYHGLPERQIAKAKYKGCCNFAEECPVDKGSCQQCYRFACYETTKLLANALGLKKEQYTTCFQSRLGKTPWIKPYTDDVIKSLAERGVKSVLAFSPAFVADCLETTIEVGEEYRDMFMEHGGERWQLVESLNVHPAWVAALKTLIEARLPQPVS